MSEGPIPDFIVIATVLGARSARLFKDFSIQATKNLKFSLAYRGMKAWSSAIGVIS